jgi:hypothetical protein
MSQASQVTNPVIELHNLQCNEINFLNNRSKLQENNFNIKDDIYSNYFFL